MFLHFCTFIDLFSAEHGLFTASRYVCIHMKSCDFFKRYELIVKYGYPTIMKYGGNQIGLHAFVIALIDLHTPLLSYNIMF